MLSSSGFIFFFFFNDTATTEIYTLSLHDALPISSSSSCDFICVFICVFSCVFNLYTEFLLFISSGCLMLLSSSRSEEHTSELQSLAYLVCRLLLEKKKCSLCTSHPA